MERKVLLVYYSPGAQQRLEKALRGQQLQIHSVDGRRSETMGAVRGQPIKVVVVDHGANDLNVRQAVRQIGQMMPRSLVMAVYEDRDSVDIYERAQRIGTAESLGAALQRYLPSSIT